MSLMKQYTPESLPPSLPFLYLFLFRTKINSPLSDQISDETWYIWHLASTIYPDSYSQNQLPLPPSLKPKSTSLPILPLSASCLRNLSISLFSPLFYLFPQFLKWRKTQKSLVWKSSVNKERNITSKTIVFNLSTFPLTFIITVSCCWRP